MELGFACDRCERVEARPASPWCARCGCELTALAPPVPREVPGDDNHEVEAVTAGRKVGRALRSYGTLVSTVLVAAALAFDPLGKWVIAPFALLLVLIAGLFLAVVVAGRHELAALARDRETRVVHGLEHACIAVLGERGHRIASGATRKGAFELDRAAGTTPADVERATRAAIRRLLAGETGLAYSPRCGTSQLVAVTLYAAIIAGGGVTSIVFGVPMGAVMLGCAVLCVIAQLAAPSLGLLAQRTLTVSTRFAGADVGAVTVRTGPLGPRFVIPVAVRCALARPWPAGAASSSSKAIGPFLHTWRQPTTSTRAWAHLAPARESFSAPPALTGQGATPMCRPITCEICQRPTWAGCGAHVEQALGHVPPSDRCRCRDAPGAAAGAGRASPRRR